MSRVLRLSKAFMFFSFILVGHAYAQAPAPAQSAPNAEEVEKQKRAKKLGNIQESWSVAQADQKKNELKGNTAVVQVESDEANADSVPEGQELVAIDFPEPTDIKDIIRAVSLWTGKNVILGRDVSGNVQMISPKKVTKEEAYQAFLSALNLLGLTTVETGKVIKILPVRTAVKGNLKTFLGSSWTPMTDAVITQIVPLKYIDAKQIQTTLSRIVSSNSMIAYQPTNTLIISDSGYKVKRILDIIQLLDVQTQQPKLKIVPIKYADAKSIADKVSEIYKGTQGGKKSSGSKYLTYKIMTDERSNSVVIFGPPRTISDVQELVRKFDIRVGDPSRQSSIHVRPLDYADAKKIATTLSALASGSKRSSSSSLRRPPRSGRNKKANTNAAPDVASFSDNLKITADESSNSLLVTGSRAAYESINSIIKKLDIRKSQVFVEADVLDISVKGGFEAGTSIFAGQGTQDGQKLAYTWEGAQIGNVLGAQALGAQSSDGRIPQQGLTQALGTFQKDFTVGVLAGKTVNIPGIGEISPGALIKLVKTDGNSRELASPHILTANNEEAVITVGDKLYFKTNEVSGVSGVAAERVQSEDVDLTLELKPNISNTNYVTLNIKLEANTGTIDITRGVPSIAKRKMSQIVTVKNSQTVVISGLMKTSESESYKKIPLLGDIPILGWLFRNSTISKQRDNLMVFLTPHIIHGANDLAQVYKQKIEERDEYFRVMFGDDYKEDDFYKRIPSMDDGKHVADAFDRIEAKSRKKMMRSIRQDMGFTRDEINMIEEEESRQKSAVEAETSAAFGASSSESVEDEPTVQGGPLPLNDSSSDGYDDEYSSSDSVDEPADVEEAPAPAESAPAESPEPLDTPPADGGYEE